MKREVSVVYVRAAYGKVHDGGFIMNNTVNNDKKFDTAQAVGRIDYLDTNGMVAYSN